MDNKVVPKFMGTNLTYPLCLTQVAEHEYLPPIWKDMENSPKRQQLINLQRVFDDMAQRMGVRTPIVATPGLLKITLSLSFLTDHMDSLEMGLHKF